MHDCINTFSGFWIPCSRLSTTQIIVMQAVYVARKGNLLGLWIRFLLSHTFPYMLQLETSSYLHVHSLKSGVVLHKRRSPLLETISTAVQQYSSISNTSELNCKCIAANLKRISTGHSVRKAYIAVSSFILHVIRADNIPLKINKSARGCVELAG